MYVERCSFGYFGVLFGQLLMFAKTGGTGWPLFVGETYKVCGGRASLVPQRISKQWENVTLWCVINFQRRTHERGRRE